MYPETNVSKMGDGYATAKFFNTSGKEMPFEEMPVTRVKNGYRVYRRKRYFGTGK